MSTCCFSGWRVSLFFENEFLDAWSYIGFPGGLMFGSGALSGKMLIVRIIENNKIDTYFWSD